jgi:hypothetical protein
VQFLSEEEEDRRHSDKLGWCFGGRILLPLSFSSSPPAPPSPNVSVVWLPPGWRRGGWRRLGHLLGGFYTPSLAMARRWMVGRVLEPRGDDRWAWVRV